MVGLEALEIRRVDKIVAFKASEKTIAFHEDNLEVAEISEDLWQEMSPTTFLTSQRPSLDQLSLKSNNAFIEIKNWSDEISTEVTTRKPASKVNSLTINVTQICNLQCTYCAAGGDGTYGQPQTKISIQKTLPQLAYFLEKINSNETFHITFLGGEPLLYLQGIQWIADFVDTELKNKQATSDFSIVTNGTLIDDSAIRLFTKYKFNVTISIDGPPDINDQWRPAKNKTSSTLMTLQGISNLLRHKENLGRLTLHGVFHKDNLNLLDAYNFYKKYDFDIYEFTYAVENSDSQSSLIFCQQMQNIADLAWAEQGEKGLRKIGLFSQYFASLDQQIRIKNHCSAGKSFLMIDGKNNIFTCPWDVGNKEEQVGSDVQIDSNKLLPYQQNLIEKNNCQSCWAKFLCGGGCMFVHKSKTGSKNKKDPNYCFRTRMLMALVIHYFNLCRNNY